MQTCFIRDCQEPVKYLFITKTQKAFACNVRQHILCFMNTVDLDEKVLVKTKTTKGFKTYEYMSCFYTKYFKDIFYLYPSSKNESISKELKHIKQVLSQKNDTLTLKFPFRERKRKETIYNILCHRKAYLINTNYNLLENENDIDYNTINYNNSNIDVIDEEISEILKYFEQYSFYLLEFEEYKQQYVDKMENYVSEFTKLQLKSKKHNSDEMCSICLNNVLCNEGGYLSCNHMFHNKCLKQWIDLKHTTCPNCRTEFNLSKYLRCS
jgi:hypothetical protein